MYFEDVYDKVKNFWDRDFIIDNDQDGQSLELQLFYNEIEDKFVGNDDWCDLMNWSIFVVLNGLIKRGNRNINIKDVSLKEIENRFREDLQDPSWKEELGRYQGFKQDSP